MLKKNHQPTAAEELVQTQQLGTSELSAHPYPPKNMLNHFGVTCHSTWLLGVN